MSSSRDEAGDAVTVCPGCGLRWARLEEGAARAKGNASAECQHLCHELALYTLTVIDPFFIHQVAVDAYAAQHAGADSKPITVAFALIGLCLLLERGHTGKAVQRAHMRLANRSKQWPTFDAPAFRGSLTVADALAAEPGPERDEAIRRWAASVWEAWAPAHPAVRALIDRYESNAR